jgi:hypothetical protein
VLLIAWPASVLAQQDRTVGIVAGYPAAVGVLWQVAERFAIRPDVSWSRIVGESFTSINFSGNPVLGDGRVTVSETATNSQSFTVGLSGLWTLNRQESLRLYLGGRAGYSRGTSTSTTTGPFISNTSPSLNFGTTQTSTREETSEGYSGSGFFGGQYGLGNRFAVFGEIGAAYTKSELTETFETRQVGLRSGVGVIVFF